jgi:CRISPR-associated endonuclease/helicase Cas3
MNEELLAKGTGETISQHTEWCLKAGKALLDSLPLPEEQRQRIAEDVLFALAVHDVGKAASGFQRVLHGEQKDWAGRRHEVLSASFGSTLTAISPAVLLAILTHHKGLPGDGITVSGFGCLPWEQMPLEGCICPVWEEMAIEWRGNAESFTKEWEQICTAWGKNELSNVPFDLTFLPLRPAWLSRGSGRTGQRRAIPFGERLHASMVRGLTVAADHLGSAHRVPAPIPDLKAFSVSKHEARPFQTTAAQTQGSAILRAPTGSGKTEAALLWAQQNQAPKGRVFYVLPYTASINAMYRRLGPGSAPDKPGVFGPDNVGLLHSRATAALYAMMEAKEDDCSRLDRQENAKALTSLAREMWFPIRVCTPHQVLRYMLRGKGWEAMLAEFPNASFIFDEVHAYDPRVVGLTLATAKRLAGWGARFLFLSATLPNFLTALIRQTLGEIPVIVPDEMQRKDREILDRKRHSLEVRTGTLIENLEAIIEAAESCPSTLIVCNHVGTAQSLFDKLSSRFGNACALLHGRFNQEDRNSIEAKLASPLPKVFVATQVVEVSLDLDFYQAFLEPAPIDALVQRIGRVNRTGMRDPATVVLFTDQVNRYHLYCRCPGNSHMPDCRVERSIQELRTIPNPISESDLVDVANRVYSDGYIGDERQAFDEGLNHPDIVQLEQRLLAGAHQEWVEQVIESTDGTVEVLPKSLKQDYEARRREGLWIGANALLVPVRARSLGWLRPRVDTSADPWVIDAEYSKLRGLCL